MNAVSDEPLIGVPPQLVRDAMYALATARRLLDARLSPAHEQAAQLCHEASLELWRVLNPPPPAGEPPAVTLMQTQYTINLDFPK